uniref:Uncharacterized protein n=1 Tax=Glossina palpalis gambiensis TaxID=67801 RepID=A0A1B0AZF0_9MUSC
METSLKPPSQPPPRYVIVSVPLLPSPFFTRMKARANEVEVELKLKAKLELDFELKPNAEQMNL